MVEPQYAYKGPVTGPIYNETIKGLYQDDGIWIISASISIFTMTSGFGLLESGRVSAKDEVNIMVRILSK